MSGMMQAPAGMNYAVALWMNIRNPLEGRAIAFFRTIEDAVESMIDLECQNRCEVVRLDAYGGQTIWPFQTQGGKA